MLVYRTFKFLREGRNCFIFSLEIAIISRNMFEEVGVCSNYFAGANLLSLPYAGEGDRLRW